MTRLTTRRAPPFGPLAFPASRYSATPACSPTTAALPPPPRLRSTPSTSSRRSGDSWFVVRDSWIAFAIGSLGGSEMSRPCRSGDVEMCLNAEVAETASDSDCRRPRFAGNNRKSAAAGLRPTASKTDCRPRAKGMPLVANNGKRGAGGDDDRVLIATSAASASILRFRRQTS